MAGPVNWTDEDLADYNDASACMGDKNTTIDRWALNALICEVQAWRSFDPMHKFVSGPNEIVEKGRDDV